MQALWVVGGPVAIKDGTGFMLPSEVRLQHLEYFIGHVSARECCGRVNVSIHF